jgi:hypothetical protein
MPELALPIAKKQHDSINGLLAQLAAIQKHLNVVCNTIIQGHDLEKRFGDTEVGLQGVRCAKAGVYELVLTVPDKPKTAKSRKR